MFSSGWHYDTAKDLERSLTERLRKIPREPDMLVYGLRFLTALCIRVWLRLCHRLEIIGRENLPKEHSFVLVANHTSHLDALALLSLLPLNRLHRAFPAAAVDYFFTSIPRVAFSAIVVNALPFSRQVHAHQSLVLCRQLLKDHGNILILFPEGTRSAAGEPAEFKPGVGFLVAGTQIPVLPCRIAGAYECWPRYKWFPRPGPLKIIIGRPRTYVDYKPDKLSALQICRDLRNAIMELRG